MPAVGVETEDNNPNPQPVADLITFGDVLAYDVSCQVYIRQHWVDEWTLDESLECVAVTWAAAPTTPTAVLRYRYGRVLQYGESSQTLRTKRTLGGYYVRLVVTCPDGVRKWHGFVDDSADEQHGVLHRVVIIDDEPTNVFDATGVQTFSCVGMIEALARDRLNVTYYRTTTPNESISGKQIRVALSPPHFNPNEETDTKFSTLVQVPNFSTSGSLPSGAERDTYIFYAEDLYSITALGTELKWSTADMVRYLVAYHAPRNYQNKEIIPVWLYEPTGVDGWADPLPTYDSPQLDCDGLTLRDALNQLLNADRLLGYHCWVDEVTNRVYIEPFTLVETDLAIGTGITLPANNRPLKINSLYDTATALSVQNNEMEVANQIVCVSAHRVAVCRLRLMTEIVEGWPASMPADFATHIGGRLDPGLLDELYQIRDEREATQYRQLDRLFKIAPTWDWKAAIIGGGTDDVFRVDQPDFTANYTSSNARYLPYPYRLKILDYIPLKVDVDYTVADPAPAHKASNAPYQPICVWGNKHGENFTVSLNGKPNNWTKRGVRDVLHTNTDPNYYLRVRPVREHEDNAIGNERAGWKIDRKLGWKMEIEVAGAFQGVLNASSALGSGDAAPHQPQLPPSQLSVTVAFQSDRRLASVYPATPPSTVDGVRRRFFDFGDRYQCIEVLKDTIVGITAAGAYARAADRKFIRDDRGELDELAKQIATYYAVPRNILRGTSRRVTARLWPGQLVQMTNENTEHETTVNCVVTEVSIELPIGSPDDRSKPTFRWVTNRGELDPLAFLPRVIQ